MTQPTLSSVSCRCCPISHRTGCDTYGQSVHRRCARKMCSTSLDKMNSPFRVHSRSAFTRSSVLFGIFSHVWIFPILTAAQKSPDDETQEYEDNNSFSNSSLLYDDECPSCDVGGKIAAAVVVSLICGLITGAALMYFYKKKCQKTYELPLPPKDYDLTEARLDVNRNDDSTYDSDIPTVDDQTGIIKNHKKLERLVKKPTQKTEEPIEIPSAATPLIHYYESPGEDNPAIVVTPSSAKSIVDEGTNFYSNTGVAASINQPYESLDIIPEEVEYENSKLNNYEPVA